MVRVRTDPGQAEEPDLARLIERGGLLPIVSGEALEDMVLGGRAGLVERYAQEIGYPLNDRGELHKLAKYRSLEQGCKDDALKTEFLDIVASYLLEMAQRLGTPAPVVAEAQDQAGNLKVSGFARLLGFPHLGEGAASPLEILANLPLSMYVTTSPYTFLEDALSHAGKTPATELCRWHPGLDRIACVFSGRESVSGYIPTDKTPLVYHLYGLDKYEDSLVLTEDDYLDFLMAVSQGRGKDVDPVHPLVKGDLQSKALLLMGFSLASWSFRALYRGLIKPMPTTKYQRYCCLQLVPDEKERSYYERYLRQEARFDKVYWKDVQSFCRDDLSAAT